MPHKREVFSLESLVSLEFTTRQMGVVGETSHWLVASESTLEAMLSKMWRRAGRMSIKYRTYVGIQIILLYWPYETRAIARKRSKISNS